MSDLEEVSRIAAEERRNAQARVRKSIAANVEGLGCAKTGNCDPRGPSVEEPYRSPGGEHDYRCPLAIATAIREGQL